VRTLSTRIADGWVALATALAIVAVTLPLFLNPIWVAFEQGRAQATAWTGFSEPQLRQATDAILADLVFGPPAFDAEVAGSPVLNERERAHMLDVRGVFIGFYAVALVGVVGSIAIAARRRRDEWHRTWGAVRAGAIGLAVALVVAGATSFVAFDVLFETFHRLFFAGGSYTFDPSTERLVQLFPFQFWQETAIAVGAVCIAISLAVTAVATRRAGAAPAVASSPRLEGSRP
jgi:integral membrane protein (TIGR01906 family)